MKFLVESNPKHQVPPEVMIGVIDAMKMWLQRYRDNVQDTWGFAGEHGGGGILIVESLEELDIIMTEFPMAPFSETKVRGLVNLEPSLERLQIAFTALRSNG